MTDLRTTSHEALRSGDAAEARTAMDALLDRDDVAPEDFGAALDAMERLGEEGQATMFESFLRFAVDHPEASLPELTGRLEAEPLGWSGELAATVALELGEHAPEALPAGGRDRLVAALERAVQAAAGDERQARLPRAALGALGV